MKKLKLALQSFRLRNFKAVRDSGLIHFTPLTVFIGNNGSGKSSVTEGLETFQAIVLDGLDDAMASFKGVEHIWNLAVQRRWRRSTERESLWTNPVAFEFQGMVEGGSLRCKMEVNADKDYDHIFIQREQAVLKGRDVEHDVLRHFEIARPRYPGNDFEWARLGDGESILSSYLDLERDFAFWQFLNLNPQSMGSPRPQKRTGGFVRLDKDGSNIAEYLLSIRHLDIPAFNGIVETLSYVLPYSRNIDPSLATELERTVYLQLTEGNFKVPGWLLSTGTLRILALLALLRHPTPPPLICIEEIENGLDPRTIHLLVDER